MNTYSIADAAGATHTLMPGVEFASYVQRIDTPDESAHLAAPIGAYVRSRCRLLFRPRRRAAGALEVTRTAVADPPPTVRPELPKSKVHARLVDIGKLDVVFDALATNRSAYVDWFSPDWPNVYCDDERMLVPRALPPRSRPADSADLRLGLQLRIRQFA